MLIIKKFCFHQWDSNCIQVAYMQTAFSVVCGNEFADDPHCGTFLEVHLPNGSPTFGTW